jgi:hypothetical protein
MGDCFERKDAVASQIPKLMRWNYDANFKLMVIKHAEETNNCATARKFGVAEPIECATLEKTKRTIKRSKFSPKSISWAQAWEFQCR